MHTAGNIEGSSAESDINCKGLAPFQNIGEWPKEHSCNILLKTVAAFFSCPFEGFWINGVK